MASFRRAPPTRTPSAGGFVAEARDLTARTRDNFRHGLATAWLGVVLSAEDPVAALRLIPDVLEHVRATGQRLLIVNLRDYAAALASLGLYDAVAVLDGACALVAIRPVAVGFAIADAQRALGDAQYGQLVQIGAAFSWEDVDDFLMDLVAELP